MSPQPPKKPAPQPAPKGRGPQPAPKPKPQPPAQKAKAPAKPAAPLQLAAPKGSKEINFACPACGRPFAMPGRRVGRKARCSCGCRMIIPTPGGVPRALWMPPEETRKKAAQQWKTIEPDAKNATEISLETSPTKVAMYIGVLIAAAIGYFVWKNRQDAVEPAKDPSIPTTAGTSEAPKDLAPGELAGVCAQSVFAVEALDPAGAVLNRGTGFLAAKGVVATSLTSVLGAAAVRCRTSDGSLWQIPNVVGIDEATDLALLQVEGLERAPIAPDEAGITDPGTSAWAGCTGKDPVAVAFAKSPGVPAVLRLSKALPCGSPVMSAKGKLLAMAMATVTGPSDAAPAKSIALMAEKKPGVPVAEGLAITASGTLRGNERMIRRLLAAGRSAFALRTLETMAAGGGDALLWLADALLMERRPRAAALRYAEAAKAKESVAARRGEGLALLDSGDVPGALAAFRAAAAAGGAPDSLTLAGLALALARAGDPVRAGSAAESALNAPDPDHRALFCAAIAGATAKNESVEKRALAALEQQKPGEAELYLVRGECALARGDAAAAEKAFSSSRDYNGGSRALAARGRALEALGQKENAVESYVAAMDANGGDEEACLAASRTLDAAGKQDRAIAALSGLLAAEPANAAANAASGRILLASDPAKALPCLERAAKSDPDNAEYAQLLARARVAADDRSGAEAALSSYLANHKDDDVRIALALLQSDSAPEKSLVTLAEVGATTGPVAAKAAHARGTAHLALDKDAEARADWELAISLEPANGLYRFQRALAGETGDLHESRALWESYVAWGKKNSDDPARVAAAEKKLLERFGR